MKRFAVVLTVIFILAYLAIPVKARGDLDGGPVVGPGRGSGTIEGWGRPVYFIPPVPRPVFPHQSGIICRELTVTEGRHGNFREVTKTVCRDRNGRHVDRPHWRDDDRRHWRDRDRRHWRDDRWHDRRGDRGAPNRW